MGPSDPKGKPYQGSSRVQMPERTTATFLGLPVPFADEDGLGILYIISIYTYISIYILCNIYIYIYIYVCMYYDIFGLLAFADVGHLGIFWGVSFCIISFCMRSLVIFVSLIFFYACTPRNWTYGGVCVCHFRFLAIFRNDDHLFIYLFISYARPFFLLTEHRLTIMNFMVYVL